MPKGAFVVDVGRGPRVHRFIAESLLEIVPLLTARKGQAEVDYLRCEHVEHVTARRAPAAAGAR